MPEHPFKMLILKLTLDTFGRDALVRWDVEEWVGAENATWTDRYEVPAAAMGLPERIDRRQALYHGYEFCVPPSAVAWLKEMLGRKTPGGQPLWLRLVKPYGYLGMVPWERLLQPQLGCPLLRLPEFLATPPRETPSMLDVVLCGSMPVAKESFALVEDLSRIADRILEAVPRRTTLHIFVDQSCYPEFRDRWEQRGMLNGPIRLYNPEGAAAFAPPDPTSRVRDVTGRIESPWLLWIRDTLRGVSVDVAHFVCHGYLSLDRGALAFSESPVRNEDRSTARFVGAAELSAFLTQVGSWSVGFSSPEHNYSEMGLRQLADTVAQTRPGPVMHHEIPLDPDGQALAAGYRFLFGPPSGSPPASPALFTYCDPAQLYPPAEPVFQRTSGYAQGSGPIARTAEEVPADPVLESIFEAEENVPAWIAATERYVEQQNLEIRKMSRNPTRERHSEAEALRSALRDIQNVVADAASTSRSRGEL